jgi:tRNA(fMet)-specific endonuclease VapC
MNFCIGNYPYCATVKAEFFYGAMRSNNPTRTNVIQQTFVRQFRSLSFDDRAATYHGQIRAQLAIQGQLIGPYDLQIAAIALVHQMVLVTNNTREFARVLSLSLEDWT